MKLTENNIIRKINGEETQETQETQETYIQELINIQKTIQSMPKINQIEVLRIFKSNENITLNQNKYGIFVNLTEIDKSIVNKLKDYIKYTNTQEKNLIEIENQKELFKNKYFD